jgi:hypothetical protein
MRSITTLENIEHDPEQTIRNLKHLQDSYPLLFRSLVTVHRLLSGVLPSAQSSTPPLVEKTV